MYISEFTLHEVGRNEKIGRQTFEPKMSTKLIIFGSSMAPNENNHRLSLQNHFPQLDLVFVRESAFSE